MDEKEKTAFCTFGHLSTKMKINEIDYEYYYDRELDEYSTPLENKAKETKCDELVDAVLATLGEEKAIKVQSEEYRNKIETVSLEELLNP